MVSGACEALTKFVTKAFLGTMGGKQNFFELFLLKAFQNFSLYRCFRYIILVLVLKQPQLFFFPFCSSYLYSCIHIIFQPISIYLFTCFLYIEKPILFLILFKRSWHSLFAFLLFLLVPPLSCCFSSTYLYKKLNLSYYSSLSYRNKGENNFFLSLVFVIFSHSIDFVNLVTWPVLYMIQNYNIQCIIGYYQFSSDLRP